MILVAVLAVVLAVLKTTLLESFRFGGILPDLFLALAVYSSLYLGPRGGLIAGGIVGTVVELASAERSGIYPALYGLVGWVAGLAWERTMRRSAATEFLFLGALGFVVDSILLARDGGFAHGLPVALLTLILPSAIATGIAGPLASSIPGRLFLPLHVGSPSRVRGQRRSA